MKSPDDGACVLLLIPLSAHTIINRIPGITVGWVYKSELERSVLPSNM